MITTAEVFLWNTRIGIVHQNPDKLYASFEYDTDFRKSGIELSPVMMPLSEIVYEFPLLSGAPFFGLPGLVSDSLPDDFGNKIIAHWLVAKGKSIREFTAIDRLCYTGKRGMGALEYVPSCFDMNDVDESINVSDMVKFATFILQKREDISINFTDSLSYSQLVQVGSSAGGARAKALIAWNPRTNDVRSGQLDLNKDYDYWLMKFDHVKNNGDYSLSDSPEYTLIEYAYYKMALDSGISMNDCRIYSCNGENHFMTKRFDRQNGKKIHMQSLGAIAHISYKEPRLCSYEQAVQYMNIMNLPVSDIEQFYSRMVFNCLAVNQDDHVKNVSFLMDRNGTWKLSPAYDVTYSYNPTNKWLSSHQMTVNGKASHITLEDLLASGENMGLKKKKCVDIIARTQQVVTNFPRYASEVGIRESTINEINRVLIENRIKQL